MSGATKAVVIGGGLSGIAAALRLADNGWSVTLVEARPWLGGATHSFERRGRWVDNGQHVHLRCCTAYLALLHRLGVHHLTTMQNRLAVPVQRPGGPVHWLARTGWPAPAHLLPGVLGFGQLSVADRARAGLALLGLRGLDPDDPELDERGFGAWLADRHQSAAAIEALWAPICTATINAAPEEASLKLAAKVFRTVLLEDAGAADIGYSRVPLAQLHGQAATLALAEAGVSVRTRCRVREVAPVGGGFVVRWDGGERASDAVVVAVPHTDVEDVLPIGAIADGVRPSTLGESPIVDIHVVYDRPVSPLPFLAVLDSPLQWVFDRTEAVGSGEYYLAVSLSAATLWIDRPVAELRATFLPELAELLPAARTAGVLDFFVTRERSATFRQAPGSHRSRAGTRTTIPGLVLAGAWTDTGWPATMEGAVRSGNAAAQAICQDRATARPVVNEGVPG